MYLTLGELGWTAIQRLLKQVPGPLQLLAPVAVDELGEVGVPDVIDVGPPEEGDATLVRLQRVHEDHQRQEFTTDQNAVVKGEGMVRVVRVQ